MIKYYLVGSCYNMYTGIYNNEFMIHEIAGIKLSSLDKIDSFTSGYSKLELFNMIEENYGIRINHLAIKYYINNDNKPRYFRVISNDKKFNDCVNTVKKTRVSILGKTRDILLVNKNVELYKEELDKLLKILNNGDFGLFKEVYSKDNYFSFLVRRYMNSSYDNEEEKCKDLRLILLEFSSYETFRRWFIEQKKVKDKSKTKLDSNVLKKESKKNSYVVLSIEENIKNYEEKFKKKTGVYYEEYQTEEYNIDNEEFLTVDEYEWMNDYENKSLGRRH